MKNHVITCSGTQNIIRCNENDALRTKGKHTNDFDVLIYREEIDLWADHIDLLFIHSGTLGVR